MSPLDIHREKDAVTAAQNAAYAITQIIAGYKDLSILFLVSGGSPMEILKYLPSDIFDNRVTVGVSDERFSTDPAINNFAQVMQTPWFQKITAGSIDTRPLRGESLQGCGQRFDLALKNWKRENPTGKIIITQGIGLDGHTAGIMGYPQDSEYFEKTFVTTDRWAVGYDAKAKNKYPLRVTTTMPFLTMVDDAILFICGEDKQIPLKAALAKEGNLAVTPARIIHEMKHCLLFTDQQI